MKIGKIHVNIGKILLILLIIFLFLLIASIGFAIVTALGWEWLWDQFKAGE